VFGKLLTNQKIAHKIVKPYVYKALREGLKLMTTVKYKISEGSIPSLSGLCHQSHRKVHGVVRICETTTWIKQRRKKRRGKTIALGGVRF